MVMILTILESLHAMDYGVKILGVLVMMLHALVLAKIVLRLLPYLEIILVLLVVLASVDFKAWREEWWL